MIQCLRSYLFLLLMLIGNVHFVAGQPNLSPTAADPMHQFYLGTHLFRYPMPPVAELKADMALLKKQGFNLIKIQTHWAIDEAAEGVYDFSRYEPLIQYAGELGMSVYLGLTLEHAPMWLYQKYPGVRMVGRNGVPIHYETAYTLPADGKPGPCFYHPVARQKQQQYIQAIVRQLGKYKQIAFWNTWQEIAHWSEMTSGQQIDYNEYTLAQFRQWLQGRYKTLRELNEAWKTGYGNWETVGPARQGPIGSGQDVDWRYFIDNVYVADILTMRYKAIKEADPLKRPVFAHKNSPAVSSGRDWAYARCQDFMGSSSYPTWAPFSDWDDVAPRRHPIDWYSTCLTEMWSGLALGFDYIRSANPPGNPVWAAEFQGGPIGANFQMGRVPSPADIRRWMLTVVGSGATTISYWVTRAEIMAAENNGFGLLNSEGDTTARLTEAARIGKALIANNDLFGYPTRPLASVALLVDEQNFDFTASFYGTSQHLSYSMRGWYKMLWDLGIPVDFVPINQVTAKSAGQYKAAILPFPISLADSNASRLEQYMKAGGNLISEAGIGRMTETGLCPRGELSPRMRQLLGVRQTSFTMVKEPDADRRWLPQERSWGEQRSATVLQGAGPLTGDSIRANFYLETLEPVSAEPILRNGASVAGTVRQIGNGRGWLLGTYLGHNGTAYHTQSASNLVAKLMNRCGVNRENVGPLLVRKRVTGKREAWLLTNPTASRVTQAIDVTGWKTVRDLLGNSVNTANQNVSLSVDALDVQVLILEK